MITKCKTLICVHQKSMRDIHVESLRFIFGLILQKKNKQNILVEFQLEFKWKKKKLTSSLRIPGHFVTTERWHRLCTTHVQTDRGWTGKRMKGNSIIKFICWYKKSEIGFKFGFTCEIEHNSIRAKIKSAKETF